MKTKLSFKNSSRLRKTLGSGASTTLLIILFTFSFFLSPCQAQVPQGFNYQAIARDGSGNILQGTSLQVMLYIQSSSTGGTIFWKELHNPVTTNNFGLFSVVVGTGVKQTGSQAATFDQIDWKVSPKYLKTEIYYSGSWKNMGDATQLYAVPYAMAAKDLTGTGKLSIKGTTAVSDTNAIFEVKNVLGQTVFAVYPEGVRIHVDNGLAKGSKGGFAVGGFDQTKGYYGQEYLRITKDSARIYVNNNPAKGQKGGFAVGGFDQTKGSSVPFTSLTQENYFIGHNSGIHNTTGIYNSFIGYESGISNTSGKRNVFLGFRAGYSNDTASYNVFIGNEAGNSNNFGRYNTFLGYQAGYKNNTASNNLFLGYRSGYSNLAGTSNVFLGVESGRSNTTGSNNVFLGYYSGYASNAGSNVFIGEESGRNNTSGSNNNFIGFKAGWSNTTGGSNIFIGTQSGYMNSTGDMNTFFGYRAGYFNNNSYNFFAGYQAGYNNTGNYNSFIGFMAGYTNTAGSSNVFIGERAGYSNSAGNYNIIIGESAGRSHNNGYSNVLIGPECGYSMTDGRDNTFLGGWTGYYCTGSYNVMIGSQSGTNNTAGLNNTFVGYSAGRNNTGSRGVFIGYNAGYNETSSDRLYIDNSGTTTPLIWGDFDLNRMVINGNSSNNPNGRNFFVYGTAGGSYSWYAESDRSLKHQITTIPDALQKVLRMRGVNFLWNTPQEGMAGLQMGFIGQEAAEVVPEVVSINEGHYSMQYAPLTAILVEAIKDQQKQIESFKSENDNLRSRLDDLMKEVEKIKDKLAEESGGKLE